VKKLIQNFSGAKLVDNIKENVYPTPKTATWNYEVEVGRIRRNLVFWEYGIELFVSWDQLLRGAALNAVEILQYIISQK
jgi:aspartate-semialdehyde dehydrogenase